jgi:hypothetical protein
LSHFSTVSTAFRFDLKTTIKITFFILFYFI